MKRRSFQKDTRRTAAGGFSLVELLTVIAIIVLLIGILVPALSHVRKSAKVTATKAMIGTFSTGLETFRADQQLGGRYPPSASDMMVNDDTLTYQVWSPHWSLTNLRNIDISGAGLLVLALAGADLLGCPGFKTFRSGRDYWAEDTDDRENGPGDSGAYALDPDTREPVHPRVSPFIDLSRVTVTKWNPNAANGGSFEIPVELEALEAMGTPLVNAPRREYPMFLDDFGGPILYWRADPAGRVIADWSPTDSDALGAYRGFFHFRDNDDLLDCLDSSKHPVQLTAGDTNHRLAFDYPAPVNPTTHLDPTNTTQNFAAYIRNKSIQARVTPQRTDSYLLLSAGPDGVFGTADDIANFDHNGAELTDPE